MCVIAIGLRTFADASVVIWSNRDEVVARPTAPLALWPDQPALLAGRDLQAGGTWLGVHASGRFAAITNFRDPAEHVLDAQSRGALPVDYLSGRASPLDFVESIRPLRSRYRGFTLLVGDDANALIYESRLDLISALPIGISTLSNGPFSEPWPKRVRLGHAMANAAAETHSLNPAFAALADPTPAAPALLPHTGMSRAVEAALSPVWISPSPAFGVPYQTRTSTVLVRRAGRWLATERSFLDGSAARFTETTLCV